MPSARCSSSAFWALFALLAFYAPLLTHGFAFVDDYSLAGEGSSHFRTILGHGRPLLAMIDIVYDLATSHSAFVIFRALNILTVLGIFLTIRSILRPLNADQTLASLIGFMFAISPPLQVLTWWAICTPVLLAMLASLVAIRTIITGGSMLAASILVASSMLIYQPAGILYSMVIPVGLVRYGRPKWNTLVRFAVPFVSACAVAFAAILVFSRFSSGDRSLLPLNELPGKLSWYGRAALPKALTFIVPEFSPLALAITLPPLLIGFLFIAAKSGGGGLLLSFAGILAASVPLLLAKENWASSRALLSLNSYMLIVAALGIHWLHEAMPRKQIQTAIRRTVALGVLALAVYSSRLLVALVIYPQMAESAYISGILQNPALDPSKPVYVIPGSWEYSAAPVVYCDEYGASSFVNWNCHRMVRFHARQAGVPFDQFQQVSPEDASALAVEQTIDLRLIRSLRVAP